MTLFGHTFTGGEILGIGIGAQWLLAAVAHSLPAPDAKSSNAYRFVSNFVQFFAANFTLMRSGQLPSPAKVIPIDSGNNLPPAA